MSDPKYVYTFTTNVAVQVPVGIKTEALQALNLYYTGDTTVAMDQKITFDHRDSHYAVNRVYYQRVQVGVKADGGLEIIP